MHICVYINVRDLTNYKRDLSQSYHLWNIADFHFPLCYKTFNYVCTFFPQSSFQKPPEKYSQLDIQPQSEGRAQTKVEIFKKCIWK